VADRDRWWRERGERELRDILLRWDPIGVASEPDWPEDEYDSFLEPLAAQLRAGASEDEIVAFLETVVHDQLGLEPDRRREALLAHELVAWYARST
jgi:hypothetical protein